MMREETQVQEALETMSGLIHLIDDWESSGLSEAEVAALFAMEARLEGFEEMHPEFIRGMVRALAWTLGATFIEVEDGA